MKRLVCVLILWLTVMLAGGCGMVDDMGGDLKDSELAAALALDVTEVGCRAEVTLLHRDRALERQYAESYYSVSAEGKTVAEAVGGLSNRGARRINFSHVGLLVLGSEAAELLNSQAFAPTEMGLRPTVYPILAEGGASDLLSGGGDLSAVYLLENALEPRGGSAGARAVTLQELYLSLKQPGIAAVLPYAASEGGDKARGGGIAPLALAVYDGAGRQVLSESESLAWRVLLRGKDIRGEVLDLGEGASVRLLSAQVRSEVQGLAIRYEVFIRGEAAAYSSIGDLAAAERRMAEEVRELLAEAVAAQETRKVDFLGLGREIWRYEPGLWRQIGDGDYLPKLTVEFAVEAELEGGEV